MTGIYKTRLLVPLLALLMTGCTSPTKCPAPDIDTFCQNAFPIWALAKTEHLNDVNADKLKAMDEYGMKHCGWR